MPYESMPNQFLQFYNISDIWHNWLNANSISPLDACMRFLYQKEEIDQIIVGVQSATQLKEILNVDKNEILSSPNWPSKIDEKIINPSTWN